MLYVIFQNNYTREEAGELVKRRVLQSSKASFQTRSMCVDLNKDEFFVRCCREIDLCDIPMDNVLRDLLTGRTHSFDKVSGGVMSLWLMYYYNNEFIFPSSRFGENCYNIVFEISKTRDIYLYEDSAMFASSLLNNIDGVFTDYVTKKVVNVSNRGGMYYVINEGY